MVLFHGVVEGGAAQISSGTGRLGKHQSLRQHRLTRDPSLGSPMCSGTTMTHERVEHIYPIPLQPALINAWQALAH